jgi:hypothetical protein
VTDLDDRARLRLIVAALEHCGQPATYAAIAEQFRYETGRLLPEVWAASPPPWLRAAAPGAPQPRVGRED